MSLQLLPRTVSRSIGQLANDLASQTLARLIAASIATIKFTELDLGSSFSTTHAC